MLKVKCPKCGSTMLFPNTAGERVQCTSCGKNLSIATGQRPTPSAVSTRPMPPDVPAQQPQPPQQPQQSQDADVVRAICGSCQAVHFFEAKFAGAETNCPKCLGRMQIPAGAAGPGGVPLPAGQDGGPEVRGGRRGLLLAISLGAGVLVVGAVVLLLLLNEPAPEQRQEPPKAPKVIDAVYDTDELIHSFRNKPKLFRKELLGNKVTVRVHGTWKIDDFENTLQGSNYVLYLNITREERFDAIKFSFPASDKLLLSKIREYGRRRKEGEESYMTVIGILGVYRKPGKSREYLVFENAFLVSPVMTAAERQAEAAAKAEAEERRRREKEEIAAKAKAEAEAQVAEKRRREKEEKEAAEAALRRAQEKAAKEKRDREEAARRKKKAEEDAIRAKKEAAELRVKTAAAKLRLIRTGYLETGKPDLVDTGIFRLKKFLKEYGDTPSAPEAKRLLKMYAD
jgi:hypothetical protein